MLTTAPTEIMSICTATSFSKNIKINVARMANTSERPASHHTCAMRFIPGVFNSCEISTMGRGVLKHIAMTPKHSDEANMSRIE